MCHALSPYEKDPCSFWGRLVSSYITDIGEDGVRRCGLMVDLSSRVMSTGNWRWFKVCCTYQAYIRQSLCYAHPCTCTNGSRILAREGLWGASGVCILQYLAGTWRDPCLFVYFYEAAPLGWQLGVMCVPSSMLGNLISEKEAEVERGQLVPILKPELFPCCSWWRWTAAAGFFSMERGVFAEKGQRNLGFNWRHSQQAWAGSQLSKE